MDKASLGPLESCSVFYDYQELSFLGIPMTQCPKIQVSNFP